MKRYILILTCLFLSLYGYSKTFSFQEYKSHTVQSGETVYSISKKYNVSETTIYNLNPDAKNGIGINSILIIPSESTIQIEEVTFKKHKVKRKQTLYSIAKRYHITEDDIKKYNKHLYANSLKKGERLQIPIFPKPDDPNNATTSSGASNASGNGENNTQDYNIQPKETKYGIARKYGITISELEKLNPDVPDNFPVGTVLKVPTTSVIASATIEEETFDFYEVQPKEGFFRLKVKLGLSKEEIIKLNPYAEAGLKDGMILKIPKKISATSIEDISIQDLEAKITNLNPKRLVVMLPFQLKRMDVDSLGANKDLIKENRTIRVALDFYSGVLMASEFAKDKGMSVQLDVYDTEGNEDKVNTILTTHDFENVDAVIGPLLSKNVQYTANFLKKESIPVFSPLSNRSMDLTSNLFQTLPSDQLLEKSMIEYLKENKDGKKFLLISDENKAVRKESIVAAIPNITVVEPRDKGFLYAADIQNKMDKNTENWVILESDDPVIVSNVVSLLNGMPERLKVRLFTTQMGDVYDYDDVSNMHLAHLNFTFPSVSKSYKFDEKNAFLISYKNKYGVMPNKFAVRGFDVAYDILLRLAYGGNVYDASGDDLETEYVENKFRYKKKMFSGYINNAFYILKYNEDLQFEVVK